MVLIHRQGPSHFLHHHKNCFPFNYFNIILSLSQYLFSFVFTIRNFPKHYTIRQCPIIKYIISMDPTKNIKSLQANLQFLKRFEGKKSVITREGLISSLQSEPVAPVPSPRKIRINYEKFLQGNDLFQSNPPQKLVNTEPSAHLDLGIEFTNSQIRGSGKKRIEQGSKHSNRSQRPTLTISNEVDHDLQLFREKLNQSDKLPKLIKSRSDRNLPRNDNIGTHVRSLSKPKLGNLPNYELQLKKDISAASYFKQLQKFQWNLRNLQMKTNKKAAQFVHY